MDEQRKNEQVLTEFNSNKASLIRVDQNLKRCYYAYHINDLIQLYKSLFCLMNECRYKMTHTYEDKKDVCVKDCVLCNCNNKYVDLKKMYNMYINNINDIQFKYQFERSLELFLDFLMTFMGQKGMLLRDEALEDELAEGW